MSTVTAEILPNVSEDDYHADELGHDRPAFSKSIAQKLIDKSPWHARAAHPRLNPEFRREEEDKFDVGTAAHQLILEGEDAAYVVHHDTWRSNDAKEAKLYARSIGKVPLLAHQVDRVREMAAAVREQLPALDVAVPVFTDGKPERTLVWEDRGVLCKARLDWLRDDLTAIDDLKTTKASAAPEAWGKRTCFSIGGDLQAAMYLRGAQAVLGVTPAFRFVVVETSPPYALTPFFVPARELQIANTRLDFALDTWRECLETDVWPSYPKRLVPVQAPAWAENDWFDREARDEQ